MTKKEKFDLAAFNAWMKMRKALLGVGFTVVIFTIFLGLCEVVLRTTHLFGARISWSEPDPLLSWRYTPGSYYWYYKENDHPITGKINRYGFRDKEWSLQKPQNSYRIAVLGDSFVEAFQVELDYTFGALAQKYLNQKIGSRRIEVMNFGRSGSTQSEEFIILKYDVTRFSPDAVLLVFFPGNDIRDISKETAPSLRRPFYTVSDEGRLTLDVGFTQMWGYRIRRRLNWLKQHSALVSLVTERYTYFQAQKHLNTEKESKRISGYLSLCTSNPDPAYIRSFAMNKRIIQAMSRYCRKKGIHFMLVSAHNSAYITEKDRRFQAIDATFDSNFFEDDLNVFSKELRIQHLGLQRIFRRYYEKNGVSLNWGHWNYKGHEVVARAISAKLLKDLF